MESLPQTTAAGARAKRGAGNAALFALVGLGIALRLVQLFARRPLWLDESSLALNLLTRKLSTVVAGGLDFHESGPPLFIAWQWAMARLFGPSEIALRILPFAAGAGFLFAVKALAEAIGDEIAALWTVAAAAISPVLIYYDNEAKQYSIDAFLTPVLLLIAMPIIEDRARRGSGTVLLVAGVVAILFSSAAVMTLGGIALGLLLSPANRRAKRLAGLAATVLVWVVAFSLVFEFSYRDYARDPYNLRYWSTAFVDLGRSGSLRRTWAAIEEVCGSLFITGTFSQISIAAAAILVLLAAGIVAIARRRGAPLAVSLAGTCLAPFVLSAAGRLPITPRVMLFAAAPLLLAAGAGISALVRPVPETARRWLAPAFLVVSLVRPAHLAFRWTVHPPKPENAPPVIAEIERNREAEEPVYIGVRGAPAWLVYSTDWKEPNRQRLEWYLSRIGSSGPAFENAPSRGHRVENEGTEVVYSQTGHGAELLGTPSGRQSFASGFLTANADPGWAENEASRIRGAANPTIWLFFSHVDRSQDELLSAVRRAGGTLVRRLSENGVDAYRIRF